jgi:hypothetical protein
VTLTWDADAIIPLPLYVTPTVVPLVAPVVLVVLHPDDPYHRRRAFAKSGSRRGSPIASTPMMPQRAHTVRGLLQSLFDLEVRCSASSSEGR